MTRTLSAALAALALAGCGDDEKSNKDAAYKGPGSASRLPPASTPSETADAKGDARNAASIVESCFADTQDYGACKDLSEGGLEVGTGPGQVNVVAASARSYRIEAYAEGGATFAIVRQEGGKIERECSGPGCQGGTW
jgi:hypothetical protein